MRVSNELKEYENSLPPRLVVKRIYDMLNPSGTFEIIFKDYKGKYFRGTIPDSEIINLIKKYHPYHGEKRYNFPTA